MLSQFHAYVPDMWFEDGALVRRNEPPAPEEAEVLDDRGEGTDRASEVSLAVGDTIAVHFVVISAPPSDSVLSGYVAMGSNWPGAKYAQHSPGAMNEDFAKLFADFKNGVRLIKDEHIREKARAAATRRHKRPDDVGSWAKKLSNDVKDADD